MVKSIENCHGRSESIARSARNAATSRPITRKYLGSRLISSRCSRDGYGVCRQPRKNQTPMSPNTRKTPDSVTSKSQL